MSNEIEKKEPELPLQAPGFMKGMAGVGTEHLSEGSVTIPRLQLLQALSPQLQAEGNKARAGEWIHSVLDTNFGRELIIVPCYLFESVFLFAPRKTGGGLLARADDGVHWSAPNTEFKVEIEGREITYNTRTSVAASGLTRFGTSDPANPKSLPAADVSLNCVCVLPDYPAESPVILNFMRSALKAGRKFAGNLKLSTVPSFGRAFKLSSTQVQGAQGTYYAPTLKVEGFIQDQEQFKEYRKVYEHFRDRRIEFDIEKAAADAEPEGEESPDAPKY